MPLGLQYFARSIPHRARKGLYAGRFVQVGYSISEKSNQRTRRLFKPNVVNAALFSEALGKKVKLKVTTAALRLIDRCGGLDNYLLRTPDKRLFSDVGSTLKYQIGQIYKQQRLQELQAKKAELDSNRMATTLKILQEPTSSTS